MLTRLTGLAVLRTRGKSFVEFGDQGVRVYNGHFGDSTGGTVDGAIREQSLHREAGKVGANAQSTCHNWLNVGFASFGIVAMEIAHVWECRFVGVDFHCLWSV